MQYFKITACATRRSSHLWSRNVELFHVIYMFLQFQLWNNTACAFLFKIFKAQKTVEISLLFFRKTVICKSKTTKLGTARKDSSPEKSQSPPSSYLIHPSRSIFIIFFFRLVVWEVSPFSENRDVQTEEDGGVSLSEMIPQCMTSAQWLMNTWWSRREKTIVHFPVVKIWAVS